MVAFCQKHGDPISNVKLQKLLYFAEGWHLGLYSRSLFSEKIEAWPRGPVVYPVWKAYKGKDRLPISKRVPMPSVSAHVARHIADLMLEYGGLTAYSLEAMTQQEPPWREALEAAEDWVYSRNPISRETMQRHFAPPAIAA